LTPRHPTHNEQQLTESVSIGGKHNRNKAGDVGRCSSNHSLTHSQHSFNEIGNQTENCTASDQAVVTESCKVLDGTAHLDSKKTTPDHHIAENLLVLVKKDNGEEYFLLPAVRRLH
jgi:hypothetical protein